jgi:hypothetical protein
MAEQNNWWNKKETEIDDYLKTTDSYLEDEIYRASNTEF